MNFKFEFEYTFGQSWPELKFQDLIIRNSEQLVSEYVKLITYEIESNNSNIKFSNINKKKIDTVVNQEQIVRDQNVQLKKIWVQDILLDSTLVLNYCEFIPEYHRGYLDYCTQNNITVGEKISTYELYFNGDFTFEFELPFWQWYADARTQRNRKYLNDVQLELYVGDSNNQHRALLQKLKSLLDNV
jgi:hypothetical protein